MKYFIVLHFYKHLDSSFYTQVHYKALLEMQIFKDGSNQDISNRNITKYIKLLSNLYIHMEEFHLYMCFNKLYVSHHLKMSKAISCELDEESKEAYDFYKQALAKDPLLDNEKRFCEHRAIK